VFGIAGRQRTVATANETHTIVAATTGRDDPPTHGLGIAEPSLEPLTSARTNAAPLEPQPVLEDVGVAVIPPRALVERLANVG